MMKNSLLSLVATVLFCLCALSARGGTPRDSLSSSPRPLAVSNPLPSSFFHTAENTIADPSSSLAPFYEKLCSLDHPLRIVHIGDSHVRGHIFPVVLRHLLEGDFGADAVVPEAVGYKASGLAQETGEPGVVYHIVGSNGATAGTFTTDENIALVASLQPDLIIVSFGTNDAHGRAYKPQEHKEQLLALLSLLRASCPSAVFLLTTPPGAYYKSGRAMAVNPRTAAVVSTIKECGNEQDMAVWDLYTIVGGKSDACRNWRRAQMLQRDGIHFTPAGYTLQGQLLHEALIKGYNEYVADRLE